VGLTSSDERRTKIEKLHGMEVPASFLRLLLLVVVGAAVSSIIWIDDSRLRVSVVILVLVGSIACELATRKLLPVRCPFCDHNFYRHPLWYVSIPNYCPGCGEDLRPMLADSEGQPI